MVNNGLVIGYHNSLMDSNWMFITPVTSYSMGLNGDEKWDWDTSCLFNYSGFIIDVYRSS